MILALVSKPWINLTKPSLNIKGINNDDDDEDLLWAEALWPQSGHRNKHYEEEQGRCRAKNQN